MSAFAMTSDEKEPVNDVGRNPPVRAGRARRRRRIGSPRVPVVRFALATFLTLIAASAWIRQIYFDPDFQPPEALTPVAIIAVTYLLGSGLRDFIRGSDDDES